jgi:hypothetical protein
MTEKQLAGNFLFKKLQISAGREDAHGDKKAFLKIEIDPNDAPKIAALAVMPGVNFEADIFVMENLTFGGKKAE